MSAEKLLSRDVREWCNMRNTYPPQAVLSDWSWRIHRLEQSRESLQWENEDLREARDDYNASLEDWKRQAEEALKRVAELEQVQGADLADLTEVAQERDAALARIAELEQALETAVAENKELRERAGYYEERGDLKQATVEEVVQERDAALARVAELEAEKTAAPLAGDAPAPPGPRDLLEELYLHRDPRNGVVQIVGVDEKTGKFFGRFLTPGPIPDMAWEIREGEADLRRLVAQFKMAQGNGDHTEGSE